MKLPSLRMQISALYQQQAANNVLVFAGAEEAIFIANQVLVSPGDEVIVLTPCYQSLLELPKSLGAKVKELPLQWNGVTWQFDFALFEQLISKQTKLVVLNFPHNPTGYLPSITDYKKIIALVAKYEAYLLSDEVYRWSEYQAQDRLPAAVDQK